MTCQINQPRIRRTSSIKIFLAMIRSLMSLGAMFRESWFSARRSIVSHAPFEVKSSRNDIAFITTIIVCRIPYQTK
jgi:hypothetical protein